MAVATTPRPLPTPGRADEKITACRQCGFYNDVMRAKGGGFLGMRSFAEDLG